jgi:superfamily II DNA helicase RecQ
LLTLRKLWREHLASTYPTQAETLEAEVRQISEDEAVAARFRSQLTRVSGDTLLVEERTRKAASYFLPRMEALSFRTLFSVEVDNTEVRKRLKNLAVDMLPQWRMHVKTLGDIVANGFEPHRCRQIRSFALLGEAVPAKGRKKSSAFAGQIPAGTSQASVVANSQTSEVAAHDVYKDNRHPGRVAALIAWRKEKAAEQGVPAFHILHQKTLLHLADTLPSTREEFLAVPGFGPVLWKKYGVELMELLAAGEANPASADGNSRKVSVIGGAEG